MAQIKGDLKVLRGLILGNMTTAERIAYTPSDKGTYVFDTTLDKPFYWNGAQWVEGKFSIVDDLVTGGSEAVLSAEQGKILDAADIASGAVVRADIVLTKNDASTITIRLPVYTETFVIGDWAAASGGIHTYTVAAATHGIADPKETYVQELVSGDYVKVEPHQTIIKANGDVELQATEVSSGVFAGKITIR